MAEPLTPICCVCSIWRCRSVASRARRPTRHHATAVSSASSPGSEITGDELLVRTRSGMTPTERAERPVWPHARGLTRLTASSGAGRAV